MKTIKNLTTQEIHLQGFGSITIAETLDGVWNIDLFPRNSFNIRENIRIDTTYKESGDKYFECPKENADRIDEIYN